MKKLITMLLVLCLVSVIFVACRGQNDRAEDNGIVTDDTTPRTESSDRNTSDRNTNDRNTNDNSESGNNSGDRNDNGNTSGNGNDNGNTSGNGNDGGILDDAGDAVSDAVRGATDAVDDIFGGGNDTRN